MKNFSIYRASAGSGKTYLLTYNYLKLALQHPDNFKSILAVTFTNKAMQEMKSRIIETLKILSSGTHTMGDDLMKDLSISPDQLKKKSAALLTQILHNYSYFAVSTIDTFFQKVVRSFAREMGIHSGFKIELDQGKVLSDVIDQLIQTMGDDPLLVKWLTEFAIYQINAGKNWDTRTQIKKLSSELFNEKVVLRKDDIFKKLDEPDFMPAYIKMVFAKKETFENEYKILGQYAVDKATKHGLAMTDFTYGTTGVAGYFYPVSQGEIKEPGKRTMAAIEEGKWASANSPAIPAIESALADGLDLAVANLVSYYQNNSKSYFTIVQVSNYLYTLGLLSRVSEALQKYKAENEILLISDFPLFLNEIIKDSDTPFVYEKIGNRYKHYLIDEFQDTSGMQWENFKPLVRDSISQGHLNMVVGDIKQSIYRWRGGNWKILMEQVKRDIGEAYTQEESLTTNRRSKQNIVDFNNQLFSKVPHLLETDLRNRGAENATVLKLADAYEDALQHAYDQSGTGLVDIAFLNKKDAENIEDVVFERLIQQIQLLQNHHYQLSDISILVRTKEDGRKVTQALLDYQSLHPNDKYKYDLISSESLYLRKNPAVNILLQALRLTENPDEPLFAEQLSYAYCVHHNKDKELNQVSDFIQELRSTDSRSLTSVIQLGLIHFDLYAGQKDVPFLMAFQDTILDYLKYEPDSIAPFLLWWEDHQDRSIQVSGDQEAMTLMTIHKSKGLQFKAVLVPFCDWKLDHSGGFREQMIWCETGDLEPLNELPMLPLRYGSALAETAFSTEYFEEKNDAFLDNLNLLYVALTRAEEVLFVTSTYVPKNASGVNTVGDLLLEFATNEKLLTEDDDIQKRLVIGEMGQYSVYIEDRPPAWEIVAKQNLIGKSERLKFRSSRHILEENQQRSIDHGEIVHWIFSKIRIKKDFHQALEQSILKFSLSESDTMEIKQLLRKVWDLPQVSDWFSEKWQVKNESSILLENGKTKRPDRVVYEGDVALVIDYKTGKESVAHVRQIEDYKKLLERMGYGQVSGYLLYLSTQKVVSV